MKKLLLTFSLVVLFLPLVSLSSPAESRLRGKILLQVESNGEAWYVKPEDGQRMYMKDGDSAYALMRDLGLGITNLDLSKIPIGFEDRFECLDSDGDTLCDRLEDGLGTDKYSADTDNDGYDDGTEVKSDYDPLGNGKLSYDFSLAEKLKGKILLQVESNGEAWYINPDNNKRYYMPDGPSAYQIMRYLSLGITNSDLARIDVDDDDVVEENNQIAEWGYNDFIAYDGTSSEPDAWGYNDDDWSYDDSDWGYNDFTDIVIDENPDIIEDITSIEEWTTYDNSSLNFKVEYPSVFSSDSGLQEISGGERTVSFIYYDSFIYLVDFPLASFEEENITNTEELSIFLKNEEMNGYTIEDVQINGHLFVYLYDDNMDELGYYTVIDDRLVLVYFSLENFGTAENQRNIARDMMNRFEIK